PENVRGQPVKSSPIDCQPQIGLGLLRKTANRGAIERQVIGRFEQEFLVVVEHVQTAFEVGEADRDGLDPLFVGEIAHSLLTNLIGGCAGQAFRLGFQVHFFKLVVGDLEEVSYFGSHQAVSCVGRGSNGGQL